MAKAKAKKEAPDNDKRIQKIGNRLKQLRVAKGFTSYEDFAWEHEINRVQYWRMEKGLNFTMKSLLKILDVHKLSLSDFFKDIS
jgi:hypothetical protein